MSLFDKLFSKKQEGGRAVQMNVLVPHRAQGKHRTRKFMGTFECGCSTDLLQVSELALEGKNPAEHLFCDEHGAAMLYGPWEERDDMMNIQIAKEA